MQKILLITEVAVLADEVDHEVSLHNKRYRKDHKNKRTWLFNDVKSTANLDVGDDDDDDADDNSEYDRKYSYDEDALTNTPDQSAKKKNKWNLNLMRLSAMKKKKDVRAETGVVERMGVEKLLGEWEEPKMETDNLVRIFSTPHLIWSN